VAETQRKKGLASFTASRSCKLGALEGQPVDGALFVDHTADCDATRANVNPPNFRADALPTGAGLRSDRDGVSMAPQILRIRSGRQESVALLLTARASGVATKLAPSAPVIVPPAFGDHDRLPTSWATINE
jgi:hypothetical protein